MVQHKGVGGRQDGNNAGRVPEEDLTILAREIVREAGITQDPEREAELEGNKLALEAAKTQVIVASGLLVGMAAVVGILPETSLRSPLLYVAFALVILSIYTGIMGMHSIATKTARSEGFAGDRGSWGSSVWFIFGLFFFILFVLWNNPAGYAKSPGEQLLNAVVILVASFIGWYAGLTMRERRENRQSARPAPRGSPESATEQPGRVGPQTEVGGPQVGAEPQSWWRRMFGG
jgi:hypothetical protein